MKTQTNNKKKIICILLIVIISSVNVFSQQSFLKRKYMKGFFKEQRAWVKNKERKNITNNNNDEIVKENLIITSEKEDTLKENSIVLKHNTIATDTLEVTCSVDNVVNTSVVEKKYVYKKIEENIKKENAQKLSKYNSKKTLGITVFQKNSTKKEIKNRNVMQREYKKKSSSDNNDGAVIMVVAIALFLLLGLFTFWGVLIASALVGTVAAMLVVVGIGCVLAIPIGILFMYGLSLKKKIVNKY